MVKYRNTTGKIHITATVRLEPDEYIDTDLNGRRLVGKAVDCTYTAVLGLRDGQVSVVDVEMPDYALLLRYDPWLRDEDFSMGTGVSFAMPNRRDTLKWLTDEQIDTIQRLVEDNKPVFAGRLALL